MYLLHGIEMLLIHKFFCISCNYYFMISTLLIRISLHLVEFGILTVPNFQLDTFFLKFSLLLNYRSGNISRLLLAHLKFIIINQYLFRTYHQLAHSLHCAFEQVLKSVHYHLKHSPKYNTHHPNDFQ